MKAEKRKQEKITRNRHEKKKRGSQSLKGQKSQDFFT